MSQIGPSGVRALPLGVAAERSVHYCQAQPRPSLANWAEISLNFDISSSRPAAPGLVVEWLEMSKT